MTLSLKIAGEAGFGIMVSGAVFAKTAMRSGFEVYLTNEYPSLIRGGHNVVDVVISSDQKIGSAILPLSILIALNKESVNLHKDELTGSGCLIYDGEEIALSKKDFKNVNLCSVPLMRLAKEQGGDIITRNTVALGAACVFAGIPFEQLSAALADQFKKKGPDIIDHNVRTARSGWDWVKNSGPSAAENGKKNESANRAQKILLTGLEAVGLGITAAGCKFFAGYPMTPINGLLTYLAATAEKTGMVYKQPEDEIAGINMAIGASFAGARSAVATSGGGFSLMTEGLSMAGMIEQPLVIIYGMRQGPATGLPTWSGQGDLHFILNASQGEFPRLVLAPGDPLEIFDLTLQAFNLADRWQTPVFLVLDKLLAESAVSVNTAEFLSILDSSKIDRGRLLSFEEQIKQAEIKRYELTADGVSGRPIPGRKGGVFRVNTDEHDEWGYSTEEADMVKKMVEKRNKKLDGASKETDAPAVYGPADADITLAGWGSTKGAALDAVRLANTTGTGLTLNYLHINYINPFPAEEVKKILQRGKVIIDIEANYNAQMRDWIFLKTGVKIEKTILKYTGRPFYAEEIVKKTRELVK